MVTLCRVTQGKFKLVIITQSKDEITQDKVNQGVIMQGKDKATQVTHGWGKLGRITWAKIYQGTIT